MLLDQTAVGSKLYNYLVSTNLCLFASLDKCYSFIFFKFYALHKSNDMLGLWLVFLLEIIYWISSIPEYACLVFLAYFIHRHVWILVWFVYTITISTDSSFFWLKQSIPLPLHFQVVGKKYIRLYPASLSEELYPYSETMLCNSSQVAINLNWKT